MIRSGLALTFSALACHAASGGDILPSRQAANTPIDAHCAALGEGFFSVAGSTACIRISGHISAGVGFESSVGPVSSFGPHMGGAPATGFDSETAASGDLRFDTSAGPARVYVGARKDTNPRWVIDGQ
jgi:hypothetical protein